MNGPGARFYVLSASVLYLISAPISALFLPYAVLVAVSARTRRWARSPVAVVGAA